jgi:hypothetical protein
VIKCVILVQLSEFDLERNKSHHRMCEIFIFTRKVASNLTHGSCVRVFFFLTGNLFG